MEPRMHQYFFNGWSHFSLSLKDKLHDLSTLVADLATSHVFLELLSDSKLILGGEFLTSQQVEKKNSSGVNVICHLEVGLKAVRVAALDLLRLLEVVEVAEGDTHLTIRSIFDHHCVHRNLCMVDIALV